MTIVPWVLFVVTVLFSISRIRELLFWRNMALDNAAIASRYRQAKEKLSGLIAKHRVDLDDEALWQGYNEWRKSQE